MKRVLLVDLGFVLSGYISKKLHDAGVMVQKASGTEETFLYMKRVKPDCVIVDYTQDREGILSMFEKKWGASDIKNIPSIIIADSLQKNDAGLFASYGVKSIVMKPVQADELLQKIGKFIQVQFTFDITQSLVECSLNSDILFVEIADGLNRDRIELLHYRMKELLEINKIEVTKILVIMSNITISFVDTANLEYLLDNLLSIPNASKENLKILTISDFMKDFLLHHPKFSGIQSCAALPDLLTDFNLTPEDGLNLIAAMDEAKQQNKSSISTKLRFDRLENVKIAVIDDDLVIRESMQAIFKTVKSDVTTYTDAESFIREYKVGKFELIFLDMVLPGMQGFKCLDRLRLMDDPTPVIILSSMGGRENVVKAFEKGAKQYLLKPIKSDMIIAKTMEILGGKI